MPALCCCLGAGGRGERGQGMREGWRARPRYEFSLSVGNSHKRKVGNVGLVVLLVLGEAEEGRACITGRQKEHVGARRVGQGLAGPRVKALQGAGGGWWAWIAGRC